MINFIKKDKGFALLYALLLTGAVLTVGVILMNIITKQLIFSSVNRKSETSYYYLANSGRECLAYSLENTDLFFNVNDEGDYEYPASVNITCLGQEIKLDQQPGNTSVAIYSSPSVPVEDNKFSLNLSVEIRKACFEDRNACNNSGGTLERAFAVVKAEGGNLTGPQQTKRAAVTALVY